LDEMLAVAGGKLTKAEQLGHYAFAIGKIAR
jgi:altronate dehydratase